MKKLVFILTFLLISLAAHAQDNLNDPNRNLGLFSILQGAFIDNYSVIHSISGQSSSDTHLNAKLSNAYSLNMILGYYVIQKRFSLGLGFGLDGYHSPDMNTAPLFGDLRFYLAPRQSIPFVYFDYGGLVKLGETFHKGQMLRLGAGYKFLVAKKLSMTADISLSAKSISYTNQAFSSQDAIFVKGVAFTIGFFLF